MPGFRWCCAGSGFSGLCRGEVGAERDCTELFLSLADSFRSVSAWIVRWRWTVCARRDAADFFGRVGMARTQQDGVDMLRMRRWQAREKSRARVSIERAPARSKQAHRRHQARLSTRQGEAAKTAGGKLTGCRGRLRVCETTTAVAGRRQGRSAAVAAGGRFFHSLSGVRVRPLDPCEFVDRLAQFIQVLWLG